MKTQLALMMLALLAAPAAGAAYKCVDERGLTHIGDTPPAGCTDVVMYEIRPNGTVVRRIEPTPTPEQARARQVDAERKRAADKAAAVQRRKDQALLATFSGEREFEVVRDRNIEPLHGRIRVANERLKAIEAREAKIAEELEFYQEGKSRSSKGGNAPPPMLVAEQERLRGEKQALATAISSHEREIQQIRVRFDLDRQRWVELKSGGATSAAPQAPAQAQPVRKTY
jgi:hypothetical protein